jgi:hypothetical protein
MPGAAAGVGDEDVDRSELALDPEPHRLDFGVGGDVGGHLNRTAAVPLDLAVHRGQGRRVPAMHRDAGPVPCEPPGDRRADPAGAAGDQGDLAGEGFVGCVHFELVLLTGRRKDRSTERGKEGSQEAWPESR